MTGKEKFYKVLPKVLWVLVGLVFIFELIRDAQRDGDFIGYVYAGQAVLNGTDIYTNYLNTWPPFFAIFSVPLAISHNISPIFVRVLWLLGMGLSWLIIIKKVTKLTTGKLMVFKSNAVPKLEVSFLSNVVLLPFLFVLRFVIDDLSNIQINTFLLLASILIFELTNKEKYIWAGVLLGLIISLKVYPIFILFYFIYKRTYKLITLTLGSILVFNMLPFLVFGVEDAIGFYLHFVEHKAMGETLYLHKNQSLFGFLGGLFMDVSRGFEFKFNVLSLNDSASKKLSYLIVLLGALLPMWKFRKKFAGLDLTQRWYEFSWILAAIPIISPLAWKYYFVFVFPLLSVIWNKLYPGYGKTKKVVFWISIGLLILTTDGLMPIKLSDYFEIFGCITWATILLLLIAIQSLPKSEP